jgi:hypothetical protein
MPVSLKLGNPEQPDNLLNFCLHFDYSDDLGAGEIRDATRASSPTCIAARKLKKSKQPKLFFSLYRAPSGGVSVADGDA